MATVLVHGVGFNKEWAAALNLKEFREHPSLKTLWPDVTAAERRRRLKEAHEACTGITEISSDGDNSGDVETGPSIEPAGPGPESDIQDDRGDGEDPTRATVFGEEQVQSADHPALPENDKGDQGFEGSAL